MSNDDGTVYIPIPEAGPDTVIPTDIVVLKMVHAVMFMMTVEDMVLTISEAYIQRDQDFGWLHYRRDAYELYGHTSLTKEQFIQIMSYLVAAAEYQDKLDDILEMKELLDQMI